MKNSNGGILGVAVTPNSEAPDAVQSGIWNMQDVATYEAQGKWAQPNVGPDASPITSDPTTIIVPQETTENITFGGALDSEDSNIVDYEIINISESYFTITTTNPVTNVSTASFTFSAGTVSQDETVNFEVKVTDVFGLTDTKSFTMTVQANTIPVASTLSMSGTTTFPQNGSTVLTFSGATDAEDNNLTLQHEIINVSNTSAITSVSPSSDSSSPFTFTLNSGSVSSDTTVTFDVKVTDSATGSSTKQFSVIVQSQVDITWYVNFTHGDGGQWAAGNRSVNMGSFTVPANMTLDKFWIQGGTTNYRDYGWIGASHSYFKIGGVNILTMGSTWGNWASNPGTLYDVNITGIPGGTQSMVYGYYKGNEPNAGVDIDYFRFQFV